MKRLFRCTLIIAILCLVVSCLFSPSVSFQKDLADSRFNGRFVWTETYYGSNYYTYWFESWIFDGTNKFTRYVWYTLYQDGKLVSHSGSGDEVDFSIFENELDINEAQTAIRWKLWDNQYSDWNSYSNYFFYDNGTTLRIYDTYGYKDFKKE